MENLILPAVISTAISTLTSNYYGQQASVVNRQQASVVNRQQPLSVKNQEQWQSFVVTAQPTNVFLQWSIADKQDTKQFLVQHSGDGLCWNTIENRACCSTLKYSFVHAHALCGINYYRLIITNVDGRANYSEVRQVNVDSEQKDILLESNIITKGVIKMQIKRPTSIVVHNADGLIIHRAKYAPGYQGIDMSGMAKGIYWLNAGTSVEKITVI
jgi:hypothetical protein